MHLGLLKNMFYIMRSVVCIHDLITGRCSTMIMHVMRKL